MVHHGILLLLVSLIGITPTTYGFSASAPPLMGLGAILFRPQGMQVQTSRGDDDLVEAGRFFTSAFWTGKVGGGAKVLTSSQIKELTSKQISEFRRRYGGRNGLDKKSKLILCKNGKNELMGCLGVEVTNIDRENGGSVRAPLMSNVAVGGKFRRKGVGKELVYTAEEIARKQWGYDECYLYVEKRNIPAVRFYNNLGYRTAWETNDYQTLIPKESGRIISEPTLLLCMKKKLGGGLFPSFFS